MQSSSFPATGEQHRLSAGLTWIIAIACGMSVANLYYNQPLLAAIARTFHATVAQVGLVSMLTQVGYALGMFLFVPLGDMTERRRPIVALLIAVAIALVGVATAQSIPWIACASLIVGITTVVPQMLIPLAAQLAPPNQRGRVIGNVMSGLLIGILVARTVSGFVGGALGWRSMFWVAAVTMFGLALTLRYTLPISHPEIKLNYKAVLRSIGHLIRTEGTLREAAVIAATQFGSFSVFWTSLVFFLERPPYHFGSQIAGLFGLVGVVGAGAAPVTGRLADRAKASTLVGIAIAITLVSFMFFWMFGQSLWGLVVGVILLDLGVQGAQISNQSRIYSLVPEARSRLNTVYMVTSFLGGSVGSWLGSMAWATWQWVGVCAMGTAMVAAGFAVWLYHRLKAAWGARSIKYHGPS